jgi:hypothetical protein
VGFYRVHELSINTKNILTEVVNAFFSY